MTFKRPESVLVVLYNQYRKVLVLKRIDNPHFWQSVTGSLENDETPVQTAVREVSEETSIDLHYVSEYKASENIIIDCRWVNQYTIFENWRARYAIGVTRNIEYVFCAQVRASTKIALSEHSAYLWLPKQEAMQKVSSPSNKLAIERFVPQEIACK